MKQFKLLSKESKELIISLFYFLKKLTLVPRLVPSKAGQLSTHFLHSCCHNKFGAAPYLENLYVLGTYCVGAVNEGRGCSFLLFVRIEFSAQSSESAKVFVLPLASR